MTRQVTLVFLLVIAIATAFTGTALATADAGDVEQRHSPSSVDHQRTAEPIVPLKGPDDEDDRSGNESSDGNATESKEFFHGGLTVQVYDPQSGTVIDEYDASESEMTANAESNALGAQPERPIFRDDRTRVPNPKDHPNWNGRIVQISTGCTGTIISDVHVLTAAHCVYNTTSDDWTITANSVVRPAADRHRNGMLVEPYSRIDITLVRTYQEYTNDAMGRHDVALLTLNRPIGEETETFAWASYPLFHDAYHTENFVVGYPGDKQYDANKPYPSMWVDSGSGSGQLCHIRCYDATHTYEVDTSGGQSGSPVLWYNDDRNRYEVIAVHAYGSGLLTNWGPRITSDKSSHLATWIHEDHNDEYESGPVSYPEFVFESTKWTNETGIWASVRPSEDIVANETEVRIEHTIRNVGTASADEITVSYFATDAQASDCKEVSADEKFGSETVAAPGPYESTTVIWEGTIPERFASDSHKICQIIDYGDEVQEFTQHERASRQDVGSVNVRAPSEFQVAITTVHDEVVEGDTVEVEVTVSNVGDVTGTQTVELYKEDGTTPVDSKAVTLGGDAETTVTLTAPTSQGDAPDVDLRVESADHRDSATAAVLVPATFAVTNFDAPSSVERGDSFTVRADVTNLGDVTGSQTIEYGSELLGCGVTTDRKQVTLSPGETKTVAFVCKDYVDDAAGDYDHAILSADDDASGTVTIEEPPEPPNFAVSITETNSPVEAGQTLSVTVDVQNIGEETGTQEIDLTVDGQSVTTETVTLDGGQTKTVTLNYLTGSEDAGNYDVTVRSANDSDFIPVTIEEPPEPPNFGVSITETNSPVEAGETFSVTVDVENTGEKTGTQEVALDVDGKTVDAEPVTLDDGQTKTVTLNYETGPGDAGDHDVAVSSANDSDSVTVTVEEPPKAASFDVAITGTNTPVEAGEILSVTVAVENAGDESGTQEVALDVDGQTAGTETVTLDGGQTKTVTLDYQTKSGDVGDHDVTVRSTDDSASITVTVIESGNPANFDVAVIGTNAPVEEGQPLEVTATVENLGDRSAEQEIALDVGSQTAVDTALVSLDGDESQTVTLTYATASGDAGEYDATVRSVNDSDAASVRVVEPTEEAFFEVSIVETNAPVQAGDDLTASVRVENAGDRKATKDVRLELGGETVATRTVTLDGGEAKTVTFSYVTTPDDAGERELHVTSGDDADATKVSIEAPTEPANFSVAITGTNAPVDAGETLEVTASVENVGGETGVQTIGLAVGDASGVDAVEVSLDAGETKTVTLAYDTRTGDAGDRRVVVTSESDSDATTVRVDSGSPPPAEDEPPTAKLALTTPDTVGFDAKIGFDASASTDDEGIVEYRWDFDGDGEIDRRTADKATVWHYSSGVYDEPGTYQATVTVVDADGQTDTATATITVERRDTTKPSATIDAPDTVQMGEEFTVEVGSITDESRITHVCWFVDGKAGPEGERMTLAFDEPGKHTVTLAVRDAAGNRDKFTVEIVAVKQTESDGVPDDSGTDDSDAGSNDDRSTDASSDGTNSNDAAPNSNDAGSGTNEADRKATDSVTEIDEKAAMTGPTNTEIRVSGVATTDRSTTDGPRLTATRGTNAEADAESERTRRSGPRLRAT